MSIFDTLQKQLRASGPLQEKVAIKPIVQQPSNNGLASFLESLIDDSSNKVFKSLKSKLDSILLGPFF